MPRDPWEELRGKAEETRRRIEILLGVQSTAPLDEAPEDKGAFSLATFAYAKELKTSPQAIAVQAAKVEAPAPFGPLQTVGPYVNFVPEPAAFAEAVLGAARDAGGGYGSSPPLATKVLLEHTSTNPTGPLHVGRARNPIYADALARLLRMAGFQVTREYLVNDVGRQMVVQYWGTQHLTPGQVGPPDLDKPDYRYIKYYQKANEIFDVDATAKADVAGMIQRFERGDVALTKEVRKVAEEVLRGILRSLERLDVTFDSFFWESDAILDGRVQRVIDRLMPLSREEGGSHYLDLSPFGLEGDAAKYFFVRADGTSLYTTRDIAYHLDKMDRCDVAINVLGEDQKLTFDRLKAAFRLMGIDWAPETVFYAFVSLPEGKMSTRKGRVVNLDDLLDEAVARAAEEVAKRRPDLSEERKREIAEFVGIGAVRYNIVRVQAEKRIVFRWEEALNFEGNSAPFLQYAHARACSILDRAGTRTAGDPRLLLHAQEQLLLRRIAKFPSSIREAATSRRVHTLASYLSDFAAQFNQFYRDCPVLTAGTDALRAARLELVDVSRVVLHNALDGLGLVAPREM